MSIRGNDLGPLTLEDTAGVHEVSRIGPVAAEIRLGGSSIRPRPAMEPAAHPIVHQEGTRGDHLRAKRVGVFPVHLAEIRRLSGAHQSLQRFLFAGAHDLDLKVPATGRSAGVIGGSTRCSGARVRAGVKGKFLGADRWRWKLPGDRPASLHNSKLISRELPGLGGIRIGGSGLTVMPVRPATIGRSIPDEKTAGHLEDGLVVEVPIVPPEIAEEGDPLGMAEEEGRFVVSGDRVAAAIPFQGRDPEHDPEAVAVGPHRAARGRQVAGSAHRAKIVIVPPRASSPRTS